MHVNSSTRQKEITKEFPGSVDFKINFNFTPIHVAVLDEYDAEDLERPSLDDLLNFVDEANNAPAGTDWSMWRRNYRGRSPLYLDIVDMFREKSIEPKQKKPVKVILHMVDQADPQGWTPFMWAAFTGRRQKLETLVRHGADPFTISDKGRSALHQASESKCADVMEYILSIPPWEHERFDINRHDYWGETPLHIAASGSAACVALLLDHGAKRDALQEDKQTTLHYAAYSPASEKRTLVDLLTKDSGSHINLADEDGCTPVHYYADAPDCLTLLADRGADLTHRGSTGKTVIHHACIKNQPESLALLLQRTPQEQATLRDHSGTTPMGYALQHSAACAKILLDADAIANADGADGWHLVHHAAHLGDVNFLEAVLQRPSFRRCRKTLDGKTSAEVAMQAGTWSGKIKELLLEHDSKVTRHSPKDKDAVAPGDVSS